MDLKRAIGMGIGLFIAFIGLVNAGIVVHPEGGTIVALSTDLTTLRILTFVVGLVITAGLVARRVRGALLIGILATTGVAVVINTLWGDGEIWAAVGPGVATWPGNPVATPDFSLVGDFSFGVFDAIPLATALAAIVAVMLSDFFDTMGRSSGSAGRQSSSTAGGGCRASTGSFWSTRWPPRRGAPPRRPRTPPTSRAPQGCRRAAGPGSLPWSSGCCSCSRCSSHRWPG